MTRAFSHRVVAAFTLVEILISIMILALGVLGLGVLFPVVIREQRMGVDASTGIVVANTAKDYLTTPLWGGALKAEPMTALGNGVRITTGNETAYGACCFGSPTPLCLYTTLADCRNRGAPANGAASAAVHAFGPGTTCAASVCRHPAIAYPAVFESGSANRGLENATKWMWQVMRNREAFNSTTTTVVNNGGLGAGYRPTNPPNRDFQEYAQGEWFGMSDPDTGDAKIGYPDVASMVSTASIKYGTVSLTSGACVTVPIQERLYPQSSTIDPQFVWDFAVHRVPQFNCFSSPDSDPLQAVIFVRRVDSRIRVTGAATSIRDAITNTSLPASDRRMAVGVDASGNPTFDGTGDYSGIRTCEVELWYSARDTDSAEYRHPDRLFVPQALRNGLGNQALKILFGQMKQPGQKLVDNLGNIYTVIGSGNDDAISAQDIDGVGGADYVTVDRPVSVGESRASNPANGSLGNGYGNNTYGEVRRAVWCVSFTPQVPVAVTTVDLIKGGF
jgi:hypothetical protein